MAKFEGRILKVESLDVCSRKFAKDCKITFPEQIQVLYNFGEDLVGIASIKRDDQGLLCECDLQDGLFSKEVYPVGGLYTNVDLTCEDGVTIIKKGRLVSMSILSEDMKAHDELKIERRHNND